jgi:hypothetical protein
MISSSCEDEDVVDVAGAAASSAKANPGIALAAHPKTNAARSINNLW